MIRFQGHLLTGEVGSSVRICWENKKNRSCYLLSNPPIFSIDLGFTAVNAIFVFHVNN